jgi:hypothetical protein
MMFVPYLWCCLVLGLFVGCAAPRAYTQLPAAEQERYRAYSRVMTSPQLHTYLDLPTAAEREAYARQVGAAQAVESLSEADRAAVLRGYPFEGMSAEALRLLWGDPVSRRGPAFDERWFYFGDAFSLAEPGFHSRTQASTVMEVALADGKVQWWQERVPADPDERRRPPFALPLIERLVD